MQSALALQSAGWAVSHLLVAAFQAREGSMFDGQEPQSIRQWRQTVTQHLRELRRSLPKDRGDLAPLRDQLARAELESERIELGYWYAWLLQHPQPKGPALTPRQLLARNLAALVDTPSAESLALLGDFAQALMPAEARGTLDLELKNALDHPDAYL